MVAVTSDARRLEQRARRSHVGAFPSARCEPSPSEDLQRAKLALQDSSQRLQGGAEMLWLPVASGTQHHPWRTLGLAVAAGTAYGWLDDATHGAVTRFTWHVLRTRVLRNGLRLR